MKRAQTKLPRQIKDLTSLDLVIKDGMIHTFAVALNGGVYSKKEMQASNGKFWILNSIDDTEQTLSPEELFDETITNIGKAMKLGAFYEI